jgi:hypothetical protein
MLTGTYENKRKRSNARQGYQCGEESTVASITEIYLGNLHSSCRENRKWRTQSPFGYSGVEAFSRTCSFAPRSMMGLTGIAAVTATASWPKRCEEAKGASRFSHATCMQWSCTGPFQHKSGANQSLAVDVKKGRRLKLEA